MLVNVSDAVLTTLDRLAGLSTMEVAYAFAETLHEEGFTVIPNGLAAQITLTATGEQAHG